MQRHALEREEQRLVVGAQRRAAQCQRLAERRVERTGAQCARQAASVLPASVLQWTRRAEAELENHVVHQISRPGDCGEVDATGGTIETNSVGGAWRDADRGQQGCGKNQTEQMTHREDLLLVWIRGGGGRE